MAPTARGRDLLDDAPDRRARRQTTSGRQCHEQNSELRFGLWQALVGMRRLGRKRYSHSGRRTGDGVCHDRFEVLATNKLDDGMDASPAIVGKELFLRGRQNLYCIAE